jgi:hypothetical protein
VTIAANASIFYLSFTCREEELLLITVLLIWLTRSSFPDKMVGEAADWMSVSALEMLPSSSSLNERLLYL